MRTEAAAPNAVTSTRSGGLMALAVALGALWVVCAWLLWRMWAFDVERYYGFSVFPLAGYLLMMRLEGLEVSSDARKSGVLWASLAIGGAFLLGATNLLLRSSPLWTAAGWLACLAAIGSSIGLLGNTGGRVWARAAAFPLGFTLTALPWPSVVQTPVVLQLRSLNANLAADLVSWAGQPAIAHGTVIETGAGWVGIDEACSGIVGLQTAIMLGLFFGELRGLSRLRRIVLLAGSIIIALTANLARASWLTWRAATDGIAAVHSVHEVAGVIEMCAAAAGVLLLSMMLKSGPLAPLPVERRHERTGVRLHSAVLVSLAVMLLATETWYRVPSREPRDPHVSWTLLKPNQEWRELDLPPGTADQLRYDAALNLAWHDPVSGRDWITLHMNWDSDSALRYGPSMHAPEICLPAAGAQLDAALGNATVTINGIALEVRWARFLAGGESFHTFSCLWDSSRAQALDTEANAATDLLAGRVAMIRERRRHLGIEQITIVLNRCRSDDEALALVREMAPLILQAKFGPR